VYGGRSGAQWQGARGSRPAHGRRNTAELGTGGWREGKGIQLVRAGNLNWRGLNFSAAKSTLEECALARAVLGGA
jgi:hypothetical protein